MQNVRKVMLDYKERIKKLYSLINPCRLCPHECGVNRADGEKGKCRSGLDVYISSSNLHFGEEPPVSGFSGSGTIFFTNCNLSCVFCQNYPISQLGHGNQTSVKELAAVMLELQEKGAHNINFVTPTHVLPMAVEALCEARKNGLGIPLVYNCGGYERVETLKLLEGIVDIYMPDAKYSIEECSAKYSGAPDYPEHNKKALKEMYRQVGGLVLDKHGIAVKGLIIRHLVIPNNIANSIGVLSFIAKDVSRTAYLSLMSQYHPAHLSHKFSELSRTVTRMEYDRVLSAADKLGLNNGWKQEV
jgi:putative pyruvate formate lyase activating enzyme